MKKPTTLIHRQAQRTNAPRRANSTAPRERIREGALTEPKPFRKYLPSLSHMFIENLLGRSRHCSDSLSVGMSVGPNMELGLYSSPAAHRLNKAVQGKADGWSNSPNFIASGAQQDLHLHPALTRPYEAELTLYLMVKDGVLSS